MAIDARGVDKSFGSFTALDDVVGRASPAAR